MAHHYHLNTSGPRLEPSVQRNWAQPTTPVKDHSSFIRPLSDIREITEPSIVEVPRSTAATDKLPAKGSGKQTSLKQTGAIKRGNSVRIVEPNTKAKGKQRLEVRLSSSSGSIDLPEGSSTYSSPPFAVPPRASSHSKIPQPTKGITVDGHTLRTVPTRIPDRGRSSSPVRQIGDRLDPVASDSSRRIPSQTFVRDPCPFDIIDQANSRHNRITLQLQVVAPLFVGGGSIEGFVRLVVDGADWTRHKRDMLISKISIDLVGVEELVGQHRRSVFLCLATELIDTKSPPPADMVESTIPVSSRNPQWILKPSITLLPFRISLPLDVGPSPFNSKTAQIRYMLCASVHANDQGRSCTVRTSQNMTVLSTYDPERALRSLPSPLTAFDEIHLSKRGIVEIIRLTAGLHRQVWVSGTSLFVDVHVANNSRKLLKKLELSIERDILYYKHAAASTLEKSASQARIFQDKEQTILSRSSLKLGKPGLDGIAPHSNVVRTCGIDIPRSHATVRCGKFFEVRYFLNVTIGTAHIKYLSVQLPIILIHMNSLDVVPNAIGQVAAAIEEKRAQHYEAQSRKGSNPSSHNERQSSSKVQPNTASQSGRSRTPDQSRLQGKAFGAPRQQSLQRMRAEAAELERLGRELDRSPRKQRSHPKSPQNSPPKSSRPKTRSQKSAGRSANNDGSQDRKHMFALNQAPSSHSLGGSSAGSYPVLNGSNMSINIDGTPPDGRAHAMQAQDITSLSGTVRRTIRNMRSFDSLRRLRPENRRPSMPSMYDPTGAEAQSTHRRTHRSIDSGRVHLADNNDHHAARSHFSPQSPAAERSQLAFRDKPSSQNLVRRASSRLRDSFDRGKFELQAAVAKAPSSGVGTGIRQWFRDKKGHHKEKGRREEQGMDWWNRPVPQQPVPVPVPQTGMRGREKMEGIWRDGWI
ncbi:hypothetical protein K461DRAFT_322319 [Myriangium duriaei CBS 260.36]|uniref:Arrestin C-terminal-like domain-containing protein n=1 Tax=Myriangium duriaei CBS 260.36 TaxID=1168546 RepID=A0A9P4J036_9PEZI|nr:hypothetical protein K461DRAFT_322319 [Myriangium duriaei CBS 260.36]